MTPTVSRDVYRNFIYGKTTNFDFKNSDGNVTLEPFLFRTTSANNPNNNVDFFSNDVYIFERSRKQTVRKINSIATLQYFVDFLYFRHSINISPIPCLLSLFSYSSHTRENSNRFIMNKYNKKEIKVVARIRDSRKN